MFIKGTRTNFYVWIHNLRIRWQTPDWMRMNESDWILPRTWIINYRHVNYNNPYWEKYRFTIFGLSFEWGFGKW